MKRIIFKILKWLAIAFVSLVAAVIVLFYVFKKDIEKYAIRAINKEIVVPFTVKSFDVTWWKTFPNLSFRINELRIDESTPIFKKPLCTAKEVLLVFNIWDLVHGDFIIKKIKIDGLNGNLGIKNSNTNNFDILKKSDAKDSSAAPSFNLKYISVKNSQIAFKHLPTSQVINIAIANSSTDLAIANEIVNVGVDLDGTCKVYSRRRDTLIQNKAILLSSLFSVGKNLDISDLSLTLAKSTLKAKGSIQDLSGKQYTDIHFSTQSLTIAQILPWIPSKSFDQDNFKTSGNIDAKGYINGELDNLNGNIVCSLKNGSMENKQFDVLLDDIGLETTIAFGKKEEIILKTFNGSLEGQAIQVKGTLKDYGNPYVDFSIHGKLNLEKVAKFASMKQEMAGFANVDVNYEGYTKALKDINSASKWKGSGNIDLIDAALSNSASKDIFSAVNGNFKVGDNNLTVSNMKGLLLGKSFSFDGQIQKIASYLFSSEKSVTLIGSLHAKYIDYEELNYIFVDKNAPKQQTKSVYAFPRNVTAQLKIEIDAFKQGSFLANQLGGTAFLKDGSLKLQGVQMHFHEGNLKGNLSIKQDVATGNFIPIGYFECYNVAIEKLFVAFDNFSQQEITDKNLSGLIDANMSIAGIWRNDLSCDMNQLYADIEFTIRNGRLKDYGPMLALAKFVHVDDLKNIQFDPLKSSLEIKDGNIYMSNIDIKNNALSLTILSGLHSFNNVMDYHLKLSVNDLLAQKYSLRKRRNLDEYEETSYGGMNLFIHLFGNADNLKFAYDRKETAKEIVKQIKEERKEVKELLRQEFGLKPKDTLAIKPKHMKVEWEE